MEKKLVWIWKRAVEGSTFYNESFYDVFGQTKVFHNVYYKALLSKSRLRNSLRWISAPNVLKMEKKTVFIDLKNRVASKHVLSNGGRISSRHGNNL